MDHPSQYLILATDGPRTSFSNSPFNGKVNFKQQTLDAIVVLWCSDGARSISSNNLQAHSGTPISQISILHSGKQN
jgi:hypothetical protein